ncbi:MAG: acetolactate synthase small subunit [Sphingomonadales bacterium]|nr:acetolactate synthase small subunit [Sphingomonadales bacterium]
MRIKQEIAERHVLTLTVDNEAGTLARIAGMFTARGYNIDSLTVADITEDHKVSRITIVTKGPPQMIEQIIAQCERLIPVHKVTDLTDAGPHVEREEAMRLADIYRARVIDATVSSFIFEITGGPDKIDTFVALMREVGLVEVGRTGIVGLMRGANAS